MNTLLITLVALSLITACNPTSTSQNPNTNSGTANSTNLISDETSWSSSPVSTTFIYRMNSNLDSISIGSIDRANGTIIEHQAFSTGAGTAPQDAVTNLNKTFMYVAHSGTASIAQYALDQTTGLLTFVRGQSTYPGPTKMVLHPNGNFLYTLHSNNSQISVHAIDPSTGVLSFSSSANVYGAGANALAIDGSGTVLVASSDSYVKSFTINATTGALTYSGFQSPQKYSALKALGNRFYALNFYYNQIWGYDMNTSNGMISSTSMTTGDSNFPYKAIDFDSSGTHAYVVDGFSGTIESYSINPSTGYLTYMNGKTLSANCNPSSVNYLHSLSVIYTACSDSSGKTFSFELNSDGSIDVSSAKSYTISGASISSVLIVEI